MSNDFWLWAGVVALTLNGVTLFWLALNPRWLRLVSIETVTLIGSWSIASATVRVLNLSEIINRETALLLSGGIGVGVVPALWFNIYRRRR